MEFPVCERCGTPNVLSRSGARFCSPKCRVYWHRERGKMPAELASRARWIRHSSTKVPLTVDGDLASSTRAATWSDYRTAQASRAGVGLGFVLNGDGIGCIDLDHCIQDGVIAPWAQQIVNANAGTFMETSLSGTGLHIWGLLEPRPGKRIRDGRNIEVYTTGRYIAMGTPVPGTGKKLRPLALDI